MQNSRVGVSLIFCCFPGACSLSIASFVAFFVGLFLCCAGGWCRQVPASAAFTCVVVGGPASRAWQHSTPPSKNTQSWGQTNSWHRVAAQPFCMPHAACVLTRATETKRGCRPQRHLGTSVVLPESVGVPDDENRYQISQPHGVRRGHGRIV